MWFEFIVFVVFVWSDEVVSWFCLMFFLIILGWMLIFGVEVRMFDERGLCC